VFRVFLAKTAIFADNQLVRMQLFIPPVHVVAPFAFAAA
jgi:hypothetical protein